MFPLTSANSAGTRINDLLGLFGVKGGLIGAQIDALSGNSLGMLQNLQDSFVEQSSGRATNGFERQLGTGMAPFMGMASPMSRFGQLMPLCGSSYQRVDLAPGHANNPLARLLDPSRRNAAQLERLINKNPMVRSQLEASLGGRIIPDGRNDGKLTVERFGASPFGTPGMPFGFPGGFNPLGASSGLLGGGLNPLGLASGLLGGGMGLLGGGLGMAGSLLGGVGGGLGLLGGMGGLGSLLGGLGGLGGGVGGLSSLLGGLPLASPGSLIGNLALGGFGKMLGTMNPFSLAGAGLGLTSQGQWNPNTRPGLINNNSATEERTHQAEVANVLADPSLTVEDKLCLVLMLIMKKMDKDIEDETERLSKLQQQQGQADGGGNRGAGKGGLFGGAGGGGGKGGGLMGGLLGGGGIPGSQASQGGPNSSSPSIDIEAKKVERMVTKRTQMFDILKNIMDKYNQTAKGIIDSVGR